jgi:hypothetical protein
MLEILKGNHIVANGILNLVVTAILYVLVKERILFRNNKRYGKFLTNSILRNVVIIAYILILVGLLIH